MSESSENALVPLTRSLDSLPHVADQIDALLDLNREKDPLALEEIDDPFLLEAIQIVSSRIAAARALNPGGTGAIEPLAFYGDGIDLVGSDINTALSAWIPNMPSGIIKLVQECILEAALLDILGDSDLSKKRVFEDLTSFFMKFDGSSILTQCIKNRLESLKMMNAKEIASCMAFSLFILLPILLKPISFDNKVILTFACFIATVIPISILKDKTTLSEFSRVKAFLAGDQFEFSELPEGLSPQHAVDFGRDLLRLNREISCIREQVGDCLISTLEERSYTEHDHTVLALSLEKTRLELEATAKAFNKLARFQMDHKLTKMLSGSE